MDENFINEQNYVDEIVDIIRENSPQTVIAEKLENYHDNDIAEAYECLEPDERKRLSIMLGAERMSDIIAYIEEPAKYIEEADPEFAADIIENMDSDDAVDALEDVDEEISENIVSLIDDEEVVSDIDLIRSYDDDEMGSIMTTNFIEIHNDVSIKQAMKTLVSQADENDNISTIYVCDKNNKYFGAIDLKDLIIAREFTELKSLVSTSYPYVRDHDLISESLERIKDYAEDSIPVLNSDNEILGVITSQDIVEVVDDEMGEDYAMLAGLSSEEDLNEPLLKSLSKRLPWLILLFFLGLIVSSVVGIFESVVSQDAAIVCFQSLILGMAGNVGTQSLAVTIRVLMDEQLETKQKFYLIFKEVRIAFFNGVILCVLSFVVVALYLHFLKGRDFIYAFAVSGCVGTAFVVAMVISGLMGTIIPLFLHKIKIDPAVASGPLISTINDLIAVVSYYGLVWIMLINVFKII